MPSPPSLSAVELSVVVPAFNEEGNLAALVSRVRAVMDGLNMTWELIFVDDGSRDGTPQRLREIVHQEPRVRALRFSRNFGKEAAIAAGLHAARGRAVVLMDSDLQHPPEVIPAFVAKWREGFDVVYGVRDDRDDDPLARRLGTAAFYGLFKALSPFQLPAGAGDFRLFDRKAVDALNALGERVRFSKGLYSWIGFKQIGVPFEVAERAAGVSSFNARRLLGLAFDGLTAFTMLPLRVWSYVGLTISGFAFAYALYFLTRTVLLGVEVPGYPSLIVSVMFFSGVQLLSLGVLGEYLGRIFTEVKHRPLYVVAEDMVAPGFPGGAEPIPMVDLAIAPAE